MIGYGKRGENKEFGESVFGPCKVLTHNFVLIRTPESGVKKKIKEHEDVELKCKNMCTQKLGKRVFSCIYILTFGVSPDTW